MTNNLVDPNRIRTSLTSQEKRELFRLAGSMRSEHAVEIGAYVGASSCFIAAGLDDGCKLLCIDTWANDAMSEGKKDTFKEFCENTRMFTQKIIPVRGYSHDLVGKVKEILGGIDFLFIDGDHSYEGCKRDVNLYLPLVKSGGIVIFHDSGWAEGVIKVINEDVKPLMSAYDKLPNMFWGWMK